MPSRVATEFPSIVLDPVAVDYEAGRPVEGEFRVSWDGVEQFDRGIGQPWEADVLALIADIRSAGLDRRLRAGTSLYSLIISRSRRHGLRGGQPAIVFSLIPRQMTLRANLGRVQEECVGPIRLTADVKRLLDWLTTLDVD